MSLEGRRQNGCFNWFCQIFELLNSNSGGLTFLITVVYVIATIAIYKANIQSANASKKQLEEMQNNMQRKTGHILRLNFYLNGGHSTDYAL